MGRGNDAAPRILLTQPAKSSLLPLLLPTLLLLKPLLLLTSQMATLGLPGQGQAQGQTKTLGQNAQNAPRCPRMRKNAAGCAKIVPVCAKMPPVPLGVPPVLSWGPWGPQKGPKTPPWGQGGAPLGLGPMGPMWALLGPYVRTVYASLLCCTFAACPKSFLVSARARGPHRAP